MRYKIGCFADAESEMGKSAPASGGKGIAWGANLKGDPLVLPTSIMVNVAGAVAFFSAKQNTVIGASPLLIET